MIESRPVPAPHRPVEAGAEDQHAEWPRVLVVSVNPFTREYSNSLTLSTLFEGWPAHRLAQVYMPFVLPVTPMFDVCTNFWALRPWSVRRVSQHELRAPGAPIPAYRKLLMQFARRQSVLSLATPVREIVYATAGVRAARHAPTADAFAPDLIFSNLGSLSATRIALAYSRRFNVPLVPLITDDWIASEYRRVLGGRALRRQLEQAFDEMLRDAPVRLAISPRMAEEYERRYGGTFLPFTQLVDADRFHAGPRPAIDGAEIELIYAGQVALGRAAMLRRIANALLQLRAEGINARLTVYTNAAHAQVYARELTLPPVLRLAGTVPHDALPRVYAESDVLVHVESFDPAAMEYTRLSLSTKISEYLMVGRPIFAFGPADVGSIDYVVRSGGGVTVTDEAQDGLLETLRALLADATLRTRLGDTGRAFARQHHDGPIQRQRFRGVLADVMRTPRADSPRTGAL